MVKVSSGHFLNTSISIIGGADLSDIYLNGNRLPPSVQDGLKKAVVTRYMRLNALKALITPYCLSSGMEICFGQQN